MTFQGHWTKRLIKLNNVKTWRRWLLIGSIVTILAGLVGWKHPEWTLVIVTTATLLAIIYQAGEMARSTKQMRKSVELQEVQMRQWVDIGAWDAIFSEGKAMIGLAMRVRFDVTNPTNWPLTIEISATINTRSTFRSGVTFLSPKSPYTVDVTVALTDEEVKDFRGLGFVLPIEGHVLYEDIEMKKVQPFGGHMFCRIDRQSQFHSNIPMTPRPRNA